MTNEEFLSDKIITIALIAGRLVYASMRMQSEACTDPTCPICGDGPGKHSDIEFVLKPERAAEIAEQIFDAAEARILGAVPEGKQRSTPERLRLIRLNEKLRAGTIDGDERLELVEMIEAGA